MAEAGSARRLRVALLHHDSIRITSAGLPGGGASAGTFVGQLLFQDVRGQRQPFQSRHCRHVVFTQVNPLNFTMASGALILWLRFSTSP